MGIRDKLAQLAARMHDTPQYNSQGAVLFVDLDSHELPLLPDCRSSTELAELAEPPEAACHS